jgi:catechol 2,3-dioxygenase-like lactoylglutathione lyase family enzyme
VQAITFLPTLDLEATHTFYAGQLGFPMVLDQGTCRVYQVGSAFWGFCRAGVPMSDPRRVTLTIVDKDVDAWHARLSKSGVTVDGEPRENPRYRIYHFYATDPNGYQIEVQRFLHPFP